MPGYQMAARLDGYAGHDDDYWHVVAARELERRHVEAFDGNTNGAGRPASP